MMLRAAIRPKARKTARLSTDMPPDVAWRFTKIFKSDLSLSKTMGQSIAIAPSSPGVKISAGGEHCYRQLPRKELL